MDDQRTRDELDALADLFLTGTLPTDGLSPAPPVAAAPTQATAPREAAPSGGVSVLDELDGPEPYRLPVERMSSRSPSGPGGDSVGRERASGAHEGTDRRPRDRVTRPTVGARLGRAEAVFLGNLPGFAGPWLSQYAHDVAQRQGPVGLLRLDNQRVELEWLTGNASINWSDESPTFGDDSDDHGGSAFVTLTDRMAQLADREAVDEGSADAPEPVRRWLVSLTNQPIEYARRTALRLRRWTFVLGADDMAISAAARSIMQLVAMDDTGSPRDIAAVIMGSDETHSRAAVTKLNEAIDPELGITVTFAGCRQRMRPVHLERIAGENMTDALWTQLAMFFDGLEEESTAAAATSSDDEQTTPREPAVSIAAAPAPQSTEPSSAQADAGDNQAAGVAPAPQEDEQDMVHPAITAPPAAQTPIAPPRRETMPAAVAAATRETGELDLCQFLAGSEVAGPVSMEARCPDQPATQFVVDQAGRLHLLIQHAARAAGDLRSAVAQLIETRNWAVRHIDLLRLTQRQSAFDTRATPVMHVFTHQAKVAAGLIPSLGADVKLHLLQQVSVAGQSAWFSTELN